jgi:hypothetical protein
MSMELFDESLESLNLKEEDLRRAKIYTPTHKNEDIHLTIRELTRIANK